MKIIEGLLHIQIHVSKTLTALSILFLLTANSLPSFAEETAQPISPQFLQSGSIWKYNLYLESYSSSFTDTAVHFQRLEVVNEGRYELHLHDKWNLKPYFSVRNYQDSASQNLKLVAGYKNDYSKYLTFYFAASREKLITSSAWFWSAKLGLVYSDFNTTQIEKIYTEGYFESFLLLPENNASYLTASGWYKIGYREWTIDHHIFDPLVIMIRVFDTSSKQLGGADYQQLSAGPQYKYFLADPNLGISILATKTWNHSYTTTTSSQYWLLFAMEVKL